MVEALTILTLVATLIASLFYIQERISGIITPPPPTDPQPTPPTNTIDKFSTFFFSVGKFGLALLLALLLYSLMGPSPLPSPVFETISLREALTFQVGESEWDETDTSKLEALVDSVIVLSDRQPLSVEVYGYADAIPVISTTRYRGEDINERYFEGDNDADGPMTMKHGQYLDLNLYYAFLRAYRTKQALTKIFLDKGIDPGNIKFQLYANPSSEYRKVEIIINLEHVPEQ